MLLLLHGNWIRVFDLGFALLDVFSLSTPSKKVPLATEILHQQVNHDFSSCAAQPWDRRISPGDQTNSGPPSDIISCASGGPPALPGATGVPRVDHGLCSGTSGYVYLRLKATGIVHFWCIYLYRIAFACVLFSLNFSVAQ